MQFCLVFSIWSFNSLTFTLSKFVSFCRILIPFCLVCVISIWMSLVFSFVSFLFRSMIPCLACFRLVISPFLFSIRLIEWRLSMRDEVEIIERSLTEVILLYFCFLLIIFRASSYLYKLPRALVWVIERWLLSTRWRGSLSSCHFPVESSWPILLIYLGVLIWSTERFKLSFRVSRCFEFGQFRRISVPAWNFQVKVIK